MLCDQGIDGWEVFYITPGEDGSTVKTMAEDQSMRDVLRAGVMPGEIAPFRNPGYQFPMGLGLTG